MSPSWCGLASKATIDVRNLLKSLGTIAPLPPGSDGPAFLAGSRHLFCLILEWTCGLDGHKPCKHNLHLDSANYHHFHVTHPPWIA